MKKLLAALVALIGIVSLSGCTLKDQTVIQNESDLVGYSFMMTYQTIDMSGQTQTYNYYYDETLENESKTTTTGMIQMGNNTYYLQSEIINDGDETQIETISYANIETKDSNYIKSKSQNQNGEQSFEYEVYQSGEKVEQTELSLETEDKHVKIKLEYKNELTNEKVELKAKRIMVDGQTVLDVKYELESDEAGEKGKMLVYVTYDSINNINQYRYEIESNQGEKSEYIGSRKHHDDDDEDELDEEDENDDEDDDSNEDMPHTNRP